MVSRRREWAQIEDQASMEAAIESLPVDQAVVDVLTLFQNQTDQTLSAELIGEATGLADAAGADTLFGMERNGLITIGAGLDVRLTRLGVLALQSSTAHLKKS
ncbi:MAG: hypothetical protein AAF638_04560 [Pseudomonadota bacterium]